jgi:hypothetical protein
MCFSIFSFIEILVWRYQRGNQNPYIEEEQTTQWPKEKVQKNKQRSTRHTYKTKDRETHLTVRYDRSLSTQFCRNISLSSLHRDSILDTLSYIHKLNFRKFYMYAWSIVVCSFVLFLLAIVLSVLLRYTDSDFPFGIFKLVFLCKGVDLGYGI